jgi:hypothetical protein
VDIRIDLDLAVLEVRHRTARWRDSGIGVGEMTWRDQGDGWPPKFKTDRRDVRDPDSIGILGTKGSQEGSLVLFRGGWCDLEYWSGATDAEPLVEAPGWDDWLTIDTYRALLDRFIELFE